jgi:hypothetical protein
MTSVKHQAMTAMLTGLCGFVLDESGMASGKSLKLRWHFDAAKFPHSGHKFCCC